MDKMFRSLNLFDTRLLHIKTMNVIPFHPIPLYQSYSHDNTLQDYIHSWPKVWQRDFVLLGEILLFFDSI